jgi:hypothetical protein
MMVLQVPKVNLEPEDFRDHLAHKASKEIWAELVYLVCKVWEAPLVLEDLKAVLECLEQKVRKEEMVMNFLKYIPKTNFSSRICRFLQLYKFVSSALLVNFYNAVVSRNANSRNF